MNRTSEELDHYSGELGPRIKARVDEITRPEYEDPARKDLTGLDWLLFLGFLVVCAVAATVWGY